MRTPSYDAASMWTEEQEITEDDPTTVEDEYEAQRITSLPERLQQLAIESKQNQLNAITPYTERFK